MTVAIISLLTLILTIVWGVVKYYHSIGYRREDVKQQIRSWEKELGDALYKSDSDRITVAHAMLKRLCDEAVVLNKR